MVLISHYAALTSATFSLPLQIHKLRPERFFFHLLLFRFFFQSFARLSLILNPYLDIYIYIRIYIYIGINIDIVVLLGWAGNMKQGYRSDWDPPLTFRLERYTDIGCDARARSFWTTDNCVRFPFYGRPAVALWAKAIHLAVATLYNTLVGWIGTMDPRY